MKFKIGDIVISKRNPGIFRIVATKEEPLNDGLHPAPQKPANNCDYTLRKINVDVFTPDCFDIEANIELAN